MTNKSFKFQNHNNNFKIDIHNFKMDINNNLKLKVTNL